MEKKSVVVDEPQCRNIGQTVAKLKLRNDFYEREFLTSNLENEIKFRMHFFAVAICHQTHTLHHPGLNLWGWDYLEHALLEIAHTSKKLIDPAFLCNISVDDLIGHLQPFFSADKKNENCTLDRLDERANLMIETSEFILRNYSGMLSEMMTSTDEMLINKGNGLYEVLVKTEAFSDPMQKKTTFLIKLLEEAGLLKIKDPENFIPIMDYHMQRVLMRLGCVTILDEQLHQHLVARKTIKSDAKIRLACIDAFRIISNISGYPVTKMNDFFWSLGRSCCGEATLCMDNSCSKTPCTLTQIIDLIDHRHCIFENKCRGFSDKNYRNLWQPLINTHFY